VTSDASLSTVDQGRDLGRSPEHHRH
jgi:hypothetical protein